MNVAEKTQLAVNMLAAYDIPAQSVLPRWFRFYLRFKPETPPPIFGASKGAWDFLAVMSGIAFWLLADLFGLYALLGAPDASPAQWGTFLLAMVIVSLFSGLAGNMLMRAVRLSHRHEAATLGLPAWEQFHSAWRPAVEALRARSRPERFWLRSLASGFYFRKTPGPDLAERCQKPYVTYVGYIGFMAYLVFAWFLPYKAGSYGEGMILIYLLICTVGIYRTSKSRPMPPNPIAWQATNGFFTGVCFAVLCWAPVADVMHYPGPRAGFAFMVVCLAMHLTEAIWYEQQKLLAMRAERAETERQLAEMRLSALKAQIEPHFIFNTIAHLRRLIATDPARAEKMADELSDFLRASLKSLRDAFTTVVDDIKLVEAYLQIAAIRMGSRLTIAIEVDPAVATRRIPPMMLLTLVENAIQHGIEPKPEGGKITVRAETTAQDGATMLCLSVADSGLGFGKNVSAGSGLGLANIRERLRSAYGERAALKLSNAATGGVLAQLFIPLEDAR